MILDSSILIRSSLLALQGLYDEPGCPPEMQPYYCKSALLELCGWIEEINDWLLLEYAQKNEVILNNKDISDFLKNKIKKIHGFDFEKTTLIYTFILGINTVVEMENELSKFGFFTHFKKRITELTELRNPIAHTALATKPKQIDSPNSFLNDLDFFVDMFMQISYFMKLWALDQNYHHAIAH